MEEGASEADFQVGVCVLTEMQYSVCTCVGFPYISYPFAHTHDKPTAYVVDRNGQTLAWPLQNI